ncbi:hypothetical protein WJX73_000701 [Symbiochloris irregularis]|uniref:Importin N-terminal domain-containing protein n=1 Tax=Symbiochloris irregularis TaxID=706552 RepID=A0AAW1PWL1_9CHLO
MDIDQLCTILAACTHPNLQQRQAAEATLKQFQHSKGQLVNLLRVAVEPSLDLGTRQAAAITFKNLVRHDWAADDPSSPIPAEDKQAVRENLLESLIRAPPIIQKQLGECLKDVLHADYPLRWPSLLQSIVQNLTTQEQARIHGGLLALRSLMRKYEFRHDDEDGAGRAAVVGSAFPVLLHIFQGLMAMEASAEVAQLLCLVCKIFYSACYMGVPLLLLQPEHFQGWMANLHALILRPAPPGMPENLADRNAWPWWKAKKWAVHAATRMFSRYADPRVTDKNSTERQFAEMWAPQCAVQFLEAVLQLMARYAQGEWLAARVLNFCIMYLTQAIAPKHTWAVLKPHIPALLQSCVFPLACFDDEDAALWQDDPQEYIRKGYDIMEEIYNQKTSAINFVQELCKARSKACLHTVMTLASQAMTEYQAAGANASQTLARKLDGALLIVGGLNTILKKKDPYKQQLEPMLNQHIIPIFQSPWGHLRAKACWVTGQYAGIKFAQGTGTGPTFNALFQCTASALCDQDLPVQVDAVVALRYLIDALDEQQLPLVKAALPSLLNEIFSLMNKYMEIEDLVSTLESIVERFGEDIAPFAVKLTEQLVAAFWRLQGAGEQGDGDEEEEGALAAFGILRALSTVMDGVSTLPALFPPLEDIVFPLLQRMISVDGQEVFEELLELVSYFTYFPAQISPRMWSLWPLIYEAYTDWAADYLENIMVPFDNFISRGTEHFLAGQNPNYLAQASKMVEDALEGDMQEGDLCVAPRLLDIIMQRCRGRIDAYIPLYLRLVLPRIGTAKRMQFKLALLSVVANALYYDAALALQHLQPHVQSFFLFWSETINAKDAKGRLKHLTRQYDKKLHVAALTAVMAVPDAQLPADLRSALPHLLAAALQLLLALKAQQEAEEHLKADRHSSDGSSDGGLENGWGEDLDDEGDEAATLAKLAADAQSFKSLDDASDPDDQSWDDDEDDEDVESMPLDDVDVFELFGMTLRGVQGTQPQRFQALTASTNPSALAALQGMMQYVAQPTSQQ